MLDQDIKTHLNNEFENQTQEEKTPQAIYKPRSLSTKKPESKVKKYMEQEVIFPNIKRPRIKARTSNQIPSEILELYRPKQKPSAFKLKLPKLPKVVKYSSKTPSYKAKSVIFN